MMTPAQAARTVSQRLMAQCRLERDEVKSDILYQVSEAFDDFAHLVETTEGVSTPGEPKLILDWTPNPDEY